MSTIFSRIIAGELPGYKIAEDEAYCAFLDIRPYQLGHTLVVPKREVDYYYDLSREELLAINLFAQRVAKAIQQATSCRKVATLVLGLEVPHVHMHLIPINSEGDIACGPMTMPPEAGEMEQIAARIRACLSSHV